jgi:ATP-dependent Clp protease ATP-binding subunit ClpC
LSDDDSMRGGSIRTPAAQGRDPLVLVPGGPSIPWPPSDDRFTAEAKIILALAQEEAMRVGANHLGPVHLLAGMACADQGLGARAVRELGVTSDGARRALASLMGSAGARLAPDDITLAPRAQRVLEIAIGRSRQRGRSSAASEDLLLALVDEGEHFTTQLLRALNIDPDTVRQKLLELG